MKDISGLGESEMKSLKKVLDAFSHNLNKYPDEYDEADVESLLNSLYRAINTIENKPVTH